MIVSFVCKCVFLDRERERERERERDKEFVMNCYEKGKTPIDGTCDDDNAKSVKCDN